MTLRRKKLLGYGSAIVLIVFILAWAVVNLVQLGRASDAILREFVMTVSHDLRTPIAGIELSIDLLRETELVVETGAEPVYTFTFMDHVRKRPSETTAPPRRSTLRTSLPTPT